MKLILLIDDDEQIRLTFGLALRKQGYRVIEADSGITGLELARQQMPDLILSDINMPGGDGQALLHHIRADPELSSKQVVLMTGRPDLVSPRRGMEDGADDFLVKPVTLEALLSCTEARLKRADIHWRVEDRVLSKLGSSMTSVLPHEFFTPLAGIIGLTEILSSDPTGFTADEIHEFHKDIHQSALRLHRTLRNYLLILELQSDPTAHGQPAAAPAPAEVRKCLEETVETVAERHRRREDVALELAGCSIRIDTHDLSLVLEELLDNALKFSRAGSPVQVELNGDGVLRVADAGRGMTEQEMTQIAAFRQFDRKKNEQQGLGLGLDLVQKLAARNRARFSISRRPEAGMEVRIDFDRGT
jgi:signal transduction histidine kinase